MKPRAKKLMLVGVGLAFIATAVTLVLNAFEENLVFFHTPTEIHEKKVAFDRTLRVGGLVEQGSVKRDDTTTSVYFRITDNNSTIDVEYSGILPDLFREGQGVVAEGKLFESGKFVASRVFARHDETYMPPEAAEALKRSHEMGMTTTETNAENKGY